MPSYSKLIESQWTFTMAGFFDCDIFHVLAQIGSVCGIVSKKIAEVYYPGVFVVPKSAILESRGLSCENWEAGRDTNVNSMYIV